MNLLIAPNSYKECADSVSTANLFRDNLKKERINLITRPISDGGDGFLAVCKELFELDILSYSISMSYSNHLIKCEVGLNKNNKTLYIESANVLGLKIVPLEFRKPFFLNSKGMGDLLFQIAEDVKKNNLNVEKIIIGIGGTATNDLGLGLCSRFGFKLYDSKGNILDVFPHNFEKVTDIKCEKINIPFKIELIVDVENPLLGKKGATRVFASQKGATNDEIEIMERGFIKLISLFESKGLIKSEEKLSGAGGGLAAAFQILFNAKIKTAKEFLLKDLGLGKLINSIDVVITGEGSFDKKSLLNKGVWLLMDIFSSKKIFLVCGKMESDLKKKLNKNIYVIELSKIFNNDEESIRNFEDGIKQACELIKQHLSIKF